MSFSYTTTETSTWTDVLARHVCSKVATDLKQFQRWYGAPTEQKIVDYGVELTLKLALRYVDWVEYGFRRDDRWVVSTRYEVRADGTLGADDRAGGITRGHDVTCASFGSFMSHSTAWRALTHAGREAVDKMMPFTRADADEPGYVPGTFSYDRTYSASGTGIARRRFTPR